MDFMLAFITKHEGFRATCYRDSRGFLTVGIGFNLDDPSAEKTCLSLGLSYSGLRAGQPISLIQAQAVLNVKVQECLTEAQFLFPNWDQLPEKAQAVVVDMLYNMGPEKFGGFKLMITALRCFDYQEAAMQMMSSLWYKQVGLRGQEDVALMKEAA